MSVVCVYQLLLILDPSQSEGSAYPSQGGGAMYPSQTMGSDSGSYQTQGYTPGEYNGGGAVATGAFMCVICSNSYSTAEDLQHHMNKRHPN